MHIIVSAEWYDFLVRGDIVHHTPTYTVNVKIVGVHKRHAAKKEDASSDFA